LNRSTSTLEECEDNVSDISIDQDENERLRLALLAFFAGDQARNNVADAFDALCQTPKRTESVLSTPKKHGLLRDGGKSKREDDNVQLADSKDPFNFDDLIQFGRSKYVDPATKAARRRTVVL